MSKIAEVKANVEAGKAKIVPGLVQEALNEGAGAQEILAAMIEGMGVVGDKFSSGEIFVPEMLVAARAMQKGVEVLKPLLAGEGAVTLGTCIIGSFDEEAVKTLLHVEAERRVHLIVAVGVPAQPPKMKKDRLPFDELVKVFR